MARPLALRGLVVCVLTLIGFAFVVNSSQAQSTQKFEDVLKDYKRNETRPSLAKRSSAIYRLARTGDARAVEVLRKRYENKSEQKPADQVRYIVADLVGRFLGSPDAVKDLNAWTRKLKDHQDSWLAANTSAAASAHGGANDLINDLLKRRQETVMKAAVLRGLGQQAPDMPALLTLVATILESELKERTKPIDRHLWMTSCADVLLSIAKRDYAQVSTTPFRTASMKVVENFNEENTLDDTKLVCARMLSDVYMTDKIDLSLGYWAEVIDDFHNKKAGKSGGSGHGGTRSKFVGIEGSGSRIVFLIDMSSSMEQAMTKVPSRLLKRKRPGDSASAKGDDKKDEKKDEQKEEPQEKPGEQSSEKPSEKPADGKDPKDDIADKKPTESKDPDPSDDLDWKAIANRVDLAKAFLINALTGLGEETFFCVVYFGTSAEYLPGCTGMMPSTPENIAKAVDELKRLSFPKADTSKGENPEAFVRETNIHGAFLLGYRALAGNGRKPKPELLEAYEHSDPRTFAEGGDTFFLLSDGAPTMDDFKESDTTDEGDNIVGKESKESKGKAEAGRRLNFYGPYRSQHYLLRDIERMNLLRKAEIHCVGIGEADEKLLLNIANIGLGKVRMFSTPESEKKDEKPE